jgi:hypothetical protein
MAGGARQRGGVGVLEAPRGTLIHHYEVGDDDLVTLCNLIVSTTHNNQAMNEAVRSVAAEYLDGHEVTEGLLNHVEVAIRAYDPCLSCATHALGRMPLDVFVDASLGCARPFEVSRVVALADHSISTHALSPQALLQVFLRLQPGPAPECTLLAIRGESFELGEPPGAAARSHMQAALRWVPAWLDGSCTMSSGAAT